MAAVQVEFPFSGARKAQIRGTSSTPLRELLRQRVYRIRIALG
jgi:hypothetical protein